MNIDSIFIEQAISIRKEYLRCVEKIDIDQNTLIEYKKKIEDLIEEGDKYAEEFDENNDDNSSKRIYETIEEITSTIRNLLDKLKPYEDRVTQLEKESDNLYIAIKDRYPDLTTEEIKKQIIPHLER